MKKISLTTQRKEKKMKFRQGDKVIHKITGKVYIVEDVLDDGFIIVSDDYYYYSDERDPNYFELIKE